MFSFKKSKIRPTRKTRRQVPLGVEQLSERIVPALTGHDMWWHPVSGSNWSTASNWYDATTGLTALTAPGINDIAHFGTGSGANLDCLLTGSTDVGSIKADYTFNHSFTIKGDLSVGFDDSNGSVGSYWNNGNILFTASIHGIEELDIYTHANTTTGGFKFGGGSVGDKGDLGNATDQGAVYITGNAQVTFTLNTGVDLLWGANLENSGTMTFPSGADYPLTWQMPASTTASLNNFGGVINFSASDSSDTVSGIIEGTLGPQGSVLANYGGTINFSNSSNHNYHCDIPLVNGSSTSGAGIVTINDKVSAVFGATGAAVGSYGSLTILQTNASSTIDINYGKLVVSGNILQKDGKIHYANQGSAVNYCYIAATTGTTTYYLEGGYLWGDVSGKSTTLNLSSVNLVTGTDYGTPTLKFDVDLTNNYYSQIVSNANVTDSNLAVVTQVNAISGSSNLTKTFHLITTTMTMTTPSWTPSFTGTYTPILSGQGTSSGIGYSYWDVFNY